MLNILEIGDLLAKCSTKLKQLMSSTNRDDLLIAKQIILASDLTDKETNCLREMMYYQDWVLPEDKEFADEW